MALGDTPRNIGRGLRRRAESARSGFDPRRVLYFIYAGRLTVCVAVFGTALLVEGLWPFAGAGPAVSEEVRLISLVGMVAAGFFTPLAYWYSHQQAGHLSRAFLLSQAVLDIVLVTGIVHVTGGSESVFPPLLFVALVSAYALVLPMALAMVVVAAAGAAYLGDIALAFPHLLSAPVGFQVVVFAGVALASSFIGGRLRQVREELDRMEQALRRLRLDTIDVLHTLRSGVLTLDREGRVAYVNPLAEELLDVRADNWIGRDLLPELRRRAPGLAAAFRDSVRRESGVWERETELWPEGEAPGEEGREEGGGNAASSSGADGDDDGRPIPVAVRTAYLARAGATPTVTLVLHDLRPARQLEELRLRAERLEAVAELSASLAHEIRNPLASIRSAVEQLAETDDEDDEERLLSRLVLRESDRLDRLLGEFGDFAGTDVVRRQPVDVRELVQEAVEVARRHPDSGDEVEYVAEFEGDAEELSDGLWGDRDLLHRSLVNLLLNPAQVWAEKREEGGKEPGDGLSVRVLVDEGRPDMVPAEIAAGRPVRIRVVDDGPGIEPEILDRVFDPFFSGRSGGSGLGLSVAYRAVQAHGGSMTARSTPGEGATFEVVLLRRAGEPRASGNPEARTGPAPAG